MRYFSIREIRGREILDSRGQPTVEVDVILENGVMGRASVPSGASTGSHEAWELRDGDQEHFLGMGVKNAIESIQNTIFRSLQGKNALLQRVLDQEICSLDGTPEKKQFGANAILGVSLASAVAVAQSLAIPLYRYLGGSNAHQLPIPMMNVFNGGRHASNDLDIQEFMIVCHGFTSFSQALRAGSETYQHLKKILESKKISTAVGDEGGFCADSIATHQQALDLIVEAIERAGYRLGTEISLALDVAASEFYQTKENCYLCKNLSERTANKKKTVDMIQCYDELRKKYPIISIEDGLAEDDWHGWQEMYQTMGNDVMLIGDDLLATNITRLQRAIQSQTCNGILVKANQIGTLSETMDCIDLAQRAQWQTIISHRSGETEDAFISHLAVATGGTMIKAGAPCRGERLSKYNMLLRIEENLGGAASFARLPSRAKQKSPCQENGSDTMDPVTV